ncbi:uncharacterized protein LOC111138482 isoform X2 [Crassostrea virginica]|uniref:Multiple epidermal growth factor-like domains protein 10 isoform X2 n=1 Tax=Crassostrea virginica TaxID=6565 RepID=A0A8B8F2X5_CRAVI|nr:multiple epidermal growth factor-like domains protein 10 isoform X2 [Crassostrea virginica]XP_022346179.1 multiple epidermal growth factor-like domains protein 10 isoform X2 [Crassostrea virginica]
MDLPWIFLVVVSVAVYEARGAFIPYQMSLTMQKSLRPGRQGSSLNCPDIVYQFPLSSYLDTLTSMRSLDIDFYIITYNNTDTNTPQRILMSPGGGACYEDLGDSSDVMPQDSDVVECSSQKYKDLIYTESLTDGKTYKESCTIEVYNNCSQPSVDTLCVPCKGGSCPELFDCNIVKGKCNGKFICEENYVGNFCDTLSCPLDKYGPTCGKTCSVNCRPQSDAKDRNCSQSDGTCLLGCNPGWQGAKCDISCPPGSYGDSCSKTCIGNCLDGDTCGPTDGVCPRGCAAGWMNSHPCNKACVGNTYGVNCEQKCSPGCVNGTCDVTDGTCLKGCLDGYSGYLCEACPKGTYGRNCGSNCGLFCEDGECDSVTGVCAQQQCGRGWSGPKCDVDYCLNPRYERPWFNFLTLLIGYGIGSGIALILMVACYCFVQCRKERQNKFMSSSMPMSSFT